MLLFRYVEQSIMNKVKALLETPPSGFTNAFSVYLQDTFSDTSFKPTFPYVWLLGYRVAPRITRLPMIIVDMGLTRESQYEIGNRGGNLAFVQISVFAKTRGERDDLAAFFRQNLYNIPVYDYSTTPATFKYNVQVVGMDTQRISVGGDKAQMEGALTDAVMVQFGVQVLE